MRCVACDHDSKKKDRKAEGLCPKCGHRFALDPEVDGIADGFMKQAVAAVSSNGTFKYLPAQLDYEVWRRSRPLTFKQRLSGYTLVIAVIAVIASGLLVMVYMAALGSGAGFVAYAIIAVVTFRVMAKFLGPAAAARRKPKDPKAALRRYEAVNPATNKLGPGPYRPDRGREAELLERPSDERRGAGSVEIETGSEPAMFSHGAALGRLLVCERPEYRDFYIANEFHLHHACHVMGPDDLETQDGRELLDRLKQEPEMDVFVVHDATPRGIKFADEVQSDGRWFGGHAAATVLDLGLIPDQLPMFAVMLRPLTPGEMEGVAESVPGLPEGMGTDLSVIPAGSLFSLTGASVDERLPFDKNSYTERKGKDKRRGRADGG